MRRLLAVVAIVFSLAGILNACGGGGHHAKPPAATSTSTSTSSSSTAPAPPGLRAIAPYADPEPSNLFAASLGPLPGTHGSNGRLTASSLARIANGRLAKPAAAAWNTMNLYSRRYLHRNVASGFDDASYRTFARQVYWHNVWCARGACYNAAQPGFSNHGWGRADDLYNCYDTRSTFDRVGGRFGFFHGEAPGECWHVTFGRQSWGTPDPGADYNNPRLCHGSSGAGQAEFVRDVQHALTRHRFPVKASGYFTVGTVSKLRAFQRSRRLRVHTCTDAKTWKALRAKR